MKIVPDFMIDATNVYRTKNYIVKQHLYINCDNDGRDILSSNDTFYLRNKKVDKLYEMIFSDRKCINGKRIHSTSYQRKYID
jgi:hypothetical protein